MIKKNKSFAKITDILLKKLRSVIVSQNHYLNNIFDVHPLREYLTIAFHRTVLFLMWQIYCLNYAFERFVCPVIVYWDNHHCTISGARSSSNWAFSARNVHRLKGSGSSSYQTLSPRAAGEGVSTAQASEAPTEV